MHDIGGNQSIIDRESKGHIGGDEFKQQLLIGRQRQLLGASTSFRSKRSSNERSQGASSTTEEGKSFPNQLLLKMSMDLRKKTSTEERRGTSELSMAGFKVSRERMMVGSSSKASKEILD